MRSLRAIIHLPQPQLVATLFGVGEPHLVETFLIVCPVAALNKAILPRAAFVDQLVDASEFLKADLKRCFSIGMSCVAHRENHGVIGHDEKKGGSRSRARLRKSATDLEVQSRRISEYLSLVAR